MWLIELELILNEPSFDLMRTGPVTYSYLFHILKCSMIDNNLWKFDKNFMFSFISGDWPNNIEKIQKTKQ